MVSSPDSSPARGGLVGVVRRMVLAVGHHDLAAPIRRSSVALDRVLFKLTAGRWTVTGVSRIPALTLLVRNARGEQTVIPLQYHEIDGSRYIVGTNWSRPTHPLWSAWLLARPECRVNITGAETECRAVLMTGEDRQRIWDAVVKISPFHADIERKSGRQPRVFRLDSEVIGEHH
ncbi:nitroreductase/quinone reductase family protein [Mycolicibacterium neoaurum]|uniref:nitroreductase/quinone reductase family protein n=1 Tax=Mycolicibacterium neoaurum TaxID=1795 RepID=UPI003014D09E